MASDYTKMLVAEDVVAAKKRQEIITFKADESRARAMRGVPLEFRRIRIE